MVEASSHLHVLEEHRNNRARLTQAWILDIYAKILQGSNQFTAVETLKLRPQYCLTLSTMMEVSMHFAGPLSVLAVTSASRKCQEVSGSGEAERKESEE